MTIIFIRIFIILLDVFISFLIRGMSGTQVKQYWYSQINVIKSWVQLAIYLDIVVLTLLYFLYPDLLRALINLVIDV
jgi:hypothetical protein